jgi:hypothetical protein
MSGIIRLGNNENGFCQIIDVMILYDLNWNVSLARLRMTYDKKPLAMCPNKLGHI